MAKVHRHSIFTPLRFLRRARTTPEIKKLYTSMAWLYEHDDAITLLTKKIIRRVILKGARIRGEENVLEVASGTGEMTRLISRSLPKGRLVCLDISIGTLKRGKRRIEREGLRGRVDFVIGNAELAPLRDNMFDRAICCYALDTVEHPEIVISEMHRLLRRGGHLSVGYKGKPTGFLSTIDRLVWEPYLRLVWNCGWVDIDQVFPKAGFSNLATKDHIFGYYRVVTASKPL